MNTRKRWMRAGAVLSLFAWGCQTVPVSSTDLPTAPPGDLREIVVTTTDGERLRLYHVHVAGGQIIGFNEGGRWTVPVEEVASLEEGHSDRDERILGGVTALIVFGGIIVAWKEATWP